MSEIQMLAPDQPVSCLDLKVSSITSYTRSLRMFSCILSFFIQYLVSIKLLFIEIELHHRTAGSVEELVVHRAEERHM